MVDIPKKIQRDLKFIFVDRMDNVLPLVLASKPANTR
jgi:ATP-dependent Lon protease